MYTITKKNFISDDNVEYVSYGIKNDEYNINIDDICVNYNQLSNFVNLINKNNLSPIHIYDIVYDFVSCYPYN